MRFLLGAFLLASSFSASAKHVTILHTNDWQSRLTGFPDVDFNPEQTGDGTRGGMARLSTMLQAARARNVGDGPVMLLDSGDLTMGTVFHMVARERGTEFQLAKLVGYDAVTLGNHEFDFRDDGLTKMLRSAQREAGTLPPILASNLKFSPSDSRDDGLERLMQEGVLKRTHIIEKDGVRFGIFGMLGLDAGECAVDKDPVTITNPIDTARGLVKQLREQDKADVVIMLSHGGLIRKEGKWEGEDVEMANTVPGIDVIISGHSHTPLSEPVIIDKTIIVQAGSETKYFGELSIDVGPKGVEFKRFVLHKVDDSVKGDPRVTALLNDVSLTITQKYKDIFGDGFLKPILKVDETATRDFNDNVLGSLLAGAMRSGAKAEIGFIADGVIRDDLVPGPSKTLSLSDIFRFVPLGIGITDDEPGYPLIRVYANGKEVKDILETLLLALKVRDPLTYYPRFSGLRFEYNPLRVPLDQVTNVEVQDSEGKFQPVDLRDTNKLYGIGTLSYVGEFFWLVDSMSKGLLRFTPKNARGEPIRSLREAVVMGEDGKEVKSWKSVLTHFMSKGQEGTPPQLMFDAELKASPMIARPSLRPSDLLVNSTWVQKAGIALFLAFLATFAWSANAFVRRFPARKRRRRGLAVPEASEKPRPKLT